LEKLASRAKINKIRFTKDSLPNLSKLKSNYYEQVLFIDVLEYVDKDLDSLVTINSLLKNGILVISVPTPLPPKYIDYEFVHKIGYLRYRYTIKYLQEILTRSDFKIISYRLISVNKYKVLYILFSLSKLLSYFDFIGKDINSCGIVLKAKLVKYKKVRGL